MSRAWLLALGALLASGCSGSTSATSSSSGSTSGSAATSTGGSGTTTSGSGTTSGSTGGTTTTSTTTTTTGSAGTATLNPSLFTPRTVVSSYRVVPDGGFNLNRLSVFMLDVALNCPQFQNLVADGGGATLPSALNLAEFRFLASPVAPGTYPFAFNDGGYRVRGLFSSTFVDGGSQSATTLGGSATLTSAGENVDAIGTFDTNLYIAGRTTFADGGAALLLADAGPLSGSFDATFCQLPR